MIALKPIAFDNLKPRVSTAFMGDRALMDFHRAPGSLRDMVEDTYRAILSERANLPLKAYDVTAEGRSIGFAVITSEPFPLLYSFGINKEYRTESIKAKWLEALTELFGDVWQVALNSRNARAINFFLRQGFTICYEDKIHDTKLMLCPLLD